MIGRLLTPATYRCATSLAGPAIALLLAARRRAGKEDAARIAERAGIASVPRPSGYLVWLHAASVGESLAVLPLIAALLRERPTLSVLVTSGTVTSAQLLAERLPPRAFHHYVPIDRMASVRRFLDHWRPDLALWVESELWPNLVFESASRHIPMLMINARMSARSAARWQRLPRLIDPLLKGFRAILCQSDDDAGRIRALGGESARSIGNLKYDAPPLAADASDLAGLRAAIGNRPVWLAASTHEGEEDTAFAAHRRLIARWPNLLTLIVPRHPKRAEALAVLAASQGLNVARRSKSEPITAETRIYLADTLGELGLFYTLAPIVFVGGSLNPVGGHNLIEPARLGCALISGPDVTNFADAASALRAGAALAIVHGEAELAEAVALLLDDPARRHYAAESARAIAGSLGGALAKTLAALGPFLPATDATTDRRDARA